jgi:hypothetical protein
MWDIFLITNALLFVLLYIILTKKKEKEKPEYYTGTKEYFLPLNWILRGIFFILNIYRHVFLPQDRVPSEELEAHITKLQVQLEEEADSSPLISRLYDLQRIKKDLELKLFEKDDLLLR